MTFRFARSRPHAALVAVLAALLALASPAQAAYPPTAPAEALLTVTETAGFARGAEVVTGGVPVPRERAVLSTSALAIVDAQGNAVPATFTVLARWHAARDDMAAPIQWLLVRFPATVPANTRRDFRLRFDGVVANPAPTQPVTVTQAAGTIAVDTGAARFVVDTTGARLFDRIERGGVAMSTDARVASTIGGLAASGFASVRRVTIEAADALGATIVIEGAYAHAAIGDGLVSGGRRLQFTAGSPVAVVREWIDWEGERCSIGVLVCAGDQINAVTLQRWRVAITPTLTGTRTIGLQDTLGAAMTTATATGAASLRQVQRAARPQPQRFERTMPGQAPVIGTRATAAVALLASTSGALAIALRDMPDYEPQALRLIADGTLAIDLADGDAWLGAKQGTFAQFAVAPFAAGVTGSVVTATVWPVLNRPLVALPETRWIAASRATDEIPVGTLPAALASYDTALADLIDRTNTLRRDRGFEGLMTHGSFPRNWGNPVLVDELDCGPDNDPTPADDWDDPYWCGFWSDYHNTSHEAVVAAYRFGDPDPLATIAVPAALRQLHTQMIRCAPDDDYFYCGLVPTGYGGFRADFNSSHGYVENLIAYYWRTGDITVPERIARGARSLRGFLCPSRAGTTPGAVCSPTTPIADTFANLNDRVASQGYQMFRFVGLARDATYLDDWRSNTARFLTQNFALVQGANGERGFTEPSGAGSTTIITGPGTYDTTQLWMASIYDFNVLYRLEHDTLDATLGAPAIAPSRARHGWARTLVAASTASPNGDGTAAGQWPNTLRYTFTGARIGGTQTALVPGWSPAPPPTPCFDDCLYDTGKAGLTGTLARSADDTGEPALRALALDLTQHTLQSIAATPQPMGKASGELFGRLHAAVARLGAPAVDPGIVFADGFD